MFPDTTVEFSGTVLNDGDQADGYDAMFLVNGSVFENTSVDPIQPNELETTTITFTPGDEGFSAGDTLTYEFDTFFFGGSNPPTISCGTHQLLNGGNGGNGDNGGNGNGGNGADFDPSMVGIQNCDINPTDVEETEQIEGTISFFNDNDSQNAEIDFQVFAGGTVVESGVREVDTFVGALEQFSFVPANAGLSPGTYPIEVDMTVLGPA